MRFNKSKIRGQGMTEYIIIVALIAVAAIGVFGSFGNVVENQVAAISQELAGGDGGDARTAAGTAADAAKTAADTSSTLENYHTQ